MKIKKYSNPQYWLERLVCWGLPCWGLVLMFAPIIFSRFDLCHGDRGDGRFNLYLLEHARLWFLQGYGHESFWNVPFFFPHENVMAYSDLLLGIAPFYWLCRLFGDEYSSLQLLVALLALLNYFAMYWLLNKGARFGKIASASGAFLFAFAPPRLQVIGHLQIFTQFLPVLFMLLLILYWRFRRCRGPAFLLLSGATLVWTLQAYTSFYHAWMTVLAVSLFLLCGYFFAATRRRLVWVLLRRWPEMIFSAGLSAVLLIPFVIHYGAAAQWSSLRDFGEIQFPAWSTYFNTASLSYKLIQPASWNASVNLRLGFGLLTLILAVLGIIKLWRCSPWSRPFMFALGLLLLASLIPAIWYFIYCFVPGGNAFRVLSRIFFVAFPGFCLGLAYCVERLPRRRLLYLLPVAVLLFESIAVSQCRISKQFERIRNTEIANAVKQTTLPFYLSSVGGEPAYYQDIDAMWATLKCGCRSINGYSGLVPFGYGLLAYNRSEANPYLMSFPQMSRFALLWRGPDGILQVREIMETVNWNQPSSLANTVGDERSSREPDGTIHFRYSPVYLDLALPIAQRGKPLILQMNFRTDTVPKWQYFEIGRERQSFTESDGIAKVELPSALTDQPFVRLKCVFNGNTPVLLGLQCAEITQ